MLQLKQHQAITKKKKKMIQISTKIKDHDRFKKVGKWISIQKKKLQRTMERV